jgi:TrpR-related protein YerC/YecD
MSKMPGGISPGNMRRGEMKSKIRDEKLDFLFRAILTLETLEDCYNFFEDLCTVSELQEMSRRMQAAKMLSENYIYSEIAQQTGLSTATISRVNRCLKYGNDGYINVLSKLEKRR